MKKIAAIFSIMGLVIFNTCAQVAGILDTTYSDTGVTHSNFLDYRAQINDLIVLQNQKVVAAGYASGTSSNQQFAIARYNVDGTPDVSFSTDGKVRTSFSGDAEILALTCQPDGKIIATGFVNYGGIHNDIVLARYDTMGNLDASFGVAGIVLTNLGSSLGSDAPNTIALQTDGKIVVAGEHNMRPVLIRYLVNGNRDSTFGLYGVVKAVTSIGTGVLNAMHIQQDGKIVVSGGLNGSASRDFGLLRYHSEGQIDTSFGVNGKSLISIDSLLGDWPLSMQALSDGRLLLAGLANRSSGGSLGSDNFGIVLCDSLGQPDSSFSNDGIMKWALGNQDIAFDCAVQRDGKFLVAGISTSTHWVPTILRIKPDGTYDSTFAGTGISQIDIGRGAAAYHAIAIQSDDKIIAGGYATPDSFQEFAVARYIPGIIALGLMDFEKNENHFLIYPNPVKNECILRYELNESETISIDLVNLQGTTVLNLKSEWHADPGFYEDILRFPESLVPSTYFIVIKFTHGLRVVKLMKE